jgi:sodium/potassium-transporting ATPase subunit alpha
MGPKDSKRKSKGNLDELKRELELDEHRIPVEELYRRLKCDPIKVIYI